MTAVVCVIGASCQGVQPASRAPVASVTSSSTRSPVGIDASLSSSSAAARTSLSYFVGALAASDDPSTTFGLRIDVAGTLVWLDAVQRRGERSFGIVATAVDGGPRVGSVVGVADDDIVDWIIVDDDGVRGGYSLRAERARLSPSQQAAFDASLGAPLLPLP